MYPYMVLDWPFVLHEFESLRISRQSARSVLRTVRLYLPAHPGDTPGTHFCWRLSRPQGYSATGRIKSNSQ